jgi:sporulation protein YlmC with PRC-barrel domain
MSQNYLDLVRQVLDQQVVDANHLNCGKVDDVEVEFDGERLKATALLIGNGPASDRLPEIARFFSRKLLGRRKVRVAWDEISTITEEIKLVSTAREYGLDEREGLAYKIISSLPRAWKK